MHEIEAVLKTYQKNNRQNKDKEQRPPVFARWKNINSQNPTVLIKWKQDQTNSLNDDHYLQKLLGLSMNTTDARQEGWLLDFRKK